MAHPYASQVKASQKRRLASVHASAGKAHGSVNVDLHNKYPKKNAGTNREFTISGATSRPRADRYAKGGKVKKGNTTNVIIAQPKAADAAPRPVPVPVPVRPPMRPPIAAPAAPPVGAPIGAPPMAAPTGGIPPALPVGARPPGLKKGGSVSPSPVLPNNEIYHQQGKGYAEGGTVKKANGGFLTQEPGKTYRGFPHSPTTSVDDAVSAHRKGGAVKKARGGHVGGEESKAHEAKESAAMERYEQGDDDDDGKLKNGGSAKKRAFGGLGGVPSIAPAVAPKQRAARALAMKAKAGQGTQPVGGLGAMPGARPPMYKDGGAKKASGGSVEAGAGSGLGRLRESKIAAKVPAHTES